MARFTTTGGGSGGGAPGPTGATGDSAYQVALNNGFVGTEAQWLASLQGIQGTAGLQGAKGSQGTLGTQGTAGLQGSSGTQGTSGTNGVQGLSGLQGSTGAQGTAGTNGTNGLNGSNGTNGTNGLGYYAHTAYTDPVALGWTIFTIDTPTTSAYRVGDRVKGTDMDNVTKYFEGVITSISTSPYTFAIEVDRVVNTVNAYSGYRFSLVGEKGDTGIQGTAGRDGIDGANGSNGIDGINGIDGVDGIDGTNGSSAYQVAVNNGFVGTEPEWLNSLVGIQGTTGQNGQDGQDGISFIWRGSWNVSNTYSINDVVYNNGNSYVAIANITVPDIISISDTNNWQLMATGGAQGTTGQNGLDGLNGQDAIWNYTGEYNPSISYSVGDLATYNGTLWYRKNANGGNLGDTPAQNVYWDLIASKGDKGDTGDQGIQGLVGVQGLIGFQGITGQNGIQGLTGSNGTQGTQGITGIGLQGTDGSQGTQGFTGTQGANGIQGVTGFQGTNGDQGTQGTQGLQGSQGTTGLQGLIGIAGDKYFTTSTTILSIASSGQIILTVDTGLSYTQAQTILLSYNDSNYMHGNVYSYNSSTGQLVVNLKSSTGSGTYSSWTINLDGATGIQGPIGATGLSGAQGTTGAVGATGTQGLTGLQGSIGAGIQGATGTQGTQGLTGAGTQGVQGITGATGSGGIVANYGSYYHSLTQIVGSTNTPNAILLNSTSESNGFLKNYDYQMQAMNAGTYNLQFSAQLHNTGGGGSGTKVTIWIKKNGIDVTDSATYIDVPTNAPYVVAAWNFVLSLAANDYVDLWWTTDNTSIQLGAADATSGPSIPAVPSVIATITQVAGSLQGIAGTQGAMGIQGLQGTQGIQGRQGTIGLQGTAGTQGLVGIQGVNGTQGANGLQGLAGQQGLDGNQGVQGLTGAQGSTGAQGLAGTGVQGIQGIQGAIPNTTPIAGSAYQAIPNITVVNATPTTLVNFTLPAAGKWHVTYWMRSQYLSAYAAEFALYDSGGNLVPNSQFMSNYTSEPDSLESSGTGTGSIIITTTGSETYTLRGYASAGVFVSLSDNNGSTGVTWVQLTGGYVGAQGSTGDQGIQGVQGTTGTQGVTGTQGSLGTQGSQGIQGIQGITGIGYSGVTSTTSNSLTNTTPGFVVNTIGAYRVNDWVRVSYDLNAYFEGIITSIIGSTINVNAFYRAGFGTYSSWTFSLAGSAGSTGAQGTIGTQGLQGRQGTTGAGTQGTQGVQGATGIQGNLGIQGSTGAGLQGIQGVQGTIGIQGLLGLQGSTGSGTQGTTGIQGSIGAQGSSGTQGTQGIQGIQGVQGIQGNLGLGYSVTSSTLANVGTGTYTFNVANTGAYVAGDSVKVSYNNITWIAGNITSTTSTSITIFATSSAGSGGYSSWTFSLLGSTGIQGIQGLQGTLGVAGSQGTTGTTGIQGIQGTTGIQGVLGTQGTVGTQGITGSQGTIGTQGTTGVQGNTGSTGKGYSLTTNDNTWTPATSGSYTFVTNTDPTTTAFLAGDIVQLSNLAGSVGGLGQITNITTTSVTISFLSKFGSGTLTTTSTIRLAGLSGSNGAQGLTGTQGTNGTQGTTGAQGTTGSQGTTGTQGITGTQGLTGIQGIQGPLPAAPLTLSGTAGQSDPLTINSANNNGGTNYGGITRWTNTSAGAISGNKYWRINPSGTLELINNSYTSTIFSISDSGTMTIPGMTLDGNSWTTFTPTLRTNSGTITLGNGTMTAAYKQIGKTVHVRYKFLVGSTTNIGGGEIIFGLPVTAANSHYNFAGAALDNGTAWYSLTGVGAYLGSTTEFAMISYSGTGKTFNGVSNVSIFSLLDGDYITVSGTYEAA